MIKINDRVKARLENGTIVDVMVTAIDATLRDYWMFHGKTEDGKNLWFYGNDIVEPPKQKSGAERIAEERKRQIEKEGYDAEHDASYSGSVLTRAALCYVYTSLGQNPPMFQDGNNTCSSPWPWLNMYFKPTTPIRDLEKAGALIAAAIDRIQAEENMNGNNQGEKNYE